MTFGSLFAGIGGIDLGLERAGMECQWQVEIDPYCRKVLAKHWPDTERFADVKAVGKHNLGSVDLIAGGFPCQDVSLAGKRTGIKEGTRSGLWFEFHRIICELRPRYVFVENVPGILVDGMGRVLGDLAASGYDAEWQVLSAADVGAPHLRKRVWIVAYPDRDEFMESEGSQGGRVQARPVGKNRKKVGRGRTFDSGQEGGLADATGERMERRGSAAIEEPEVSLRPEILGRHRPAQGAEIWSTEPGMGRMAHGVPRRVDRLKALGNAVVPQCAEWIGRQILKHPEGT